LSEQHDAVSETELADELAETPGDGEADELLAEDEAELEGDDIELDADAEDGEADEDELDADGNAEPPRPLSKAERRIRALLEKNKAKDRAIAERDAELLQYRLTQSAPRDQAQIDFRAAAAEKQQFEREIADMSVMPEPDQNAYWARRHHELLEQRMMRHELSVNDKLDRTRFEISARDRGLSRDDLNAIEAGLAASRMQGLNPSREEILALYVGQRRIAAHDQQIARQRQREREQQQVRQREQQQVRQREQARLRYDGRQPSSVGSTASSGPNRSRRTQAEIDDAVLENTRMRDIF
jgi:hypothetical protein